MVLRHRSALEMGGPKSNRRDPVVRKFSRHAQIVRRFNRRARVLVTCDRPISTIAQASIGHPTIVLTHTDTRMAMPTGVGTLALSCPIFCSAQLTISATITCLAYPRLRVIIGGSAMVRT